MSNDVENNALAANGNEAFVVFATNCEGHTADNFMRRNEIPYKTVSGCYVMRDTGETIRETAYIIKASDYRAVRPLIVGFSDNIKPQESILVLGPRATRDAPRPAILQFIDGRPSEFLGYFCHAEEYAAKKTGNYTIDADGNYWACFHNPDDASETGDAE